MGTTKHTLFHKPRSGQQKQIELTEKQAAILLKKKLIQTTGNVPGNRMYFSNKSLKEINDVIKSVQEVEELATA